MISKSKTGFAALITLCSLSANVAMADPALPPFYQSMTQMKPEGKLGQIIKKEKVAIAQIINIWKDSTVDFMSIGDDARSSRLSVDFGKERDRDCLGADHISQDISWTYARQLVNVANKNDSTMPGNGL